MRAEYLEPRAASGRSGEGRRRHRKDVNAILLLLAVPSVWITALELGYALVPWACHQGRPGVVRAVIAAAVLFEIAIGAIAWSRAPRLAAADHDELLPRSRRRFVLDLTTAFSAMVGLLLVAQLIASFVLDPCAV